MAVSALSLSSAAECIIVPSGLTRCAAALQVAEYHEKLREAMGTGSVAVGVKALQIR